ncbi:unnamed protein product, partial [Prorocentrum cordatum]
ALEAQDLSPRKGARHGRHGGAGEAAGHALGALQVETNSSAPDQTAAPATRTPASPSMQQKADKHAADYNYQVSDFQMAGSQAGYLNFIKKYPATRSPGPAGFPYKFDWIVHRKRELANLSKGEDPYAVFSSMEIQLACQC